MELFNNKEFVFICHPHKVIFIHCKPRIATRRVVDKDDNGIFRPERVKQ